MLLISAVKRNSWLKVLQNQHLQKCQIPGSLLHTVVPPKSKSIQRYRCWRLESLSTLRSDGCCRIFSQWFLITTAEICDVYRDSFIVQISFSGAVTLRVQGGTLRRYLMVKQYVCGTYNLLVETPPQTTIKL